MLFSRNGGKLNSARTELAVPSGRFIVVCWPSHCNQTRRQLWDCLCFFPLSVCPSSVCLSTGLRRALWCGVRPPQAGVSWPPHDGAGLHRSSVWTLGGLLPGGGLRSSHRPYLYSGPGKISPGQTDVLPYLGEGDSVLRPEVSCEGPRGVAQAGAGAQGGRKMPKPRGLLGR